MENALLVGLSRQVALANELDVVANNVANIETNGFKRRATIFQEYLSPKARAESFRERDRPVSFVWDKGTALQFTQGAIDRTGNPLDVAIRSDALFVVRGAAGERYTRNGSFDLNARGELVNSDGLTVQSDQGPLVFGRSDTDIRIAADGTVTSSQGVKGKLRLVRADNPQLLRNEGRNTFSTATPLGPARPQDIRLEQGALERSNVRPVLEISRMIELNRSYQNVAMLMQKTDELRRTAINRLADQQS